MEQIGVVKLLHIPRALERGVDIFLLDLDVGFLADPRFVLFHLLRPYQAHSSLLLQIHDRGLLRDSNRGHLRAARLHLRDEPQRGGLEDLAHGAAAQHRHVPLPRQQPHDSHVRHRLAEVPEDAADQRARRGREEHAGQGPEPRAGRHAHRTRHLRPQVRVLLELDGAAAGQAGVLPRHGARAGRRAHGGLPAQGAVRGHAHHLLREEHQGEDSVSDAFPTA